MPEFEPGEGCIDPLSCIACSFCQIARLIRAETKYLKMGLSSRAQEVAQASQCSHEEVETAKNAMTFNLIIHSRENRLGSPGI